MPVALILLFLGLLIIVGVALYFFSGADEPLEGLWEHSTIL